MNWELNVFDSETRVCKREKQTMKTLFSHTVALRACIAGAALISLSSMSNAQIRGVGDFKFEFNAPSRAGNMTIQFFDFSGSSFIDMPRLNVPIPFDNTKTADQNLVIKRNAISAAIQGQFGGYTDRFEPVIQAGVRASAFANNDANANVGFRGFNITNVPFDVQRDATNPRAVDRIMWGVTMNAGRTGELVDKIINRAPLRVGPLGGNCGHSKISFENSNFNPLTSDGQFAQWHAGIIVDDIIYGATVGVLDLPSRSDGSRDTSGAAIAEALYRHMPSSIAAFATLADPAASGSSELKFDFLNSSSSASMSCGVSFGTTSDSEGVSGTYALPTPGSLALLGLGMLTTTRRRR